MPKEISSDGNVSTLDVIYPAFPAYLQLSLEYLQLLLAPIFDYVENHPYPKSCAPHDLGSGYPNASGHLHGTGEEDMPVEETANILIMTAALVAKDAVTSPLRAPFVQYKGPSGDSELAEEVREHGGTKHAVGELLTCPFCLAQWVATAFVAGSVFVPGFTRLATSTFAGVALSDFLQLAYATLQRTAEGD